MGAPIPRFERYPTLSETQQRIGTPTDAIDRLRISLPSWRARSSLPPEANAIVRDLCSAAKAAGWTPEQLVVAVKTACYGSDEVSHLDTTSERDALLARVVTTCIKEYFRES